jgi:hypothetical protein
MRSTPNEAPPGAGAGTDAEGLVDVGDLLDVGGRVGVGSLVDVDG